MYMYGGWEVEMDRAIGRGGSEEVDVQESKRDTATSTKKKTVFGGTNNNGYVWSRKDDYLRMLKGYQKKAVN
jgi:hypothetical protein